MNYLLHFEEIVEWGVILLLPIYIFSKNMNCIFVKGILCSGFLLGLTSLYAGLIWDTLIIEDVVYLTERSTAYAFKYTNPSTEDSYRISGIKTDCGCTSAVSDSKEIGPSSKGTIDVRFSPKGKVGLHEKTITISVDDLEMPEVKLKIKVNVIRPYQISPGFLFFTDDNIDEEQAVIVEIVKEAGWALTDVKSMNGGLVCGFRVERDGRHEIVASVVDPLLFSRDALKLEFVKDRRVHTQLVHVLKK